MIKPESAVLATHSRFNNELFKLVNTEARLPASAAEFEMAYQARVAMDRIKFAIKHAEQFGPSCEPLREVAMQLLDALQRLEDVDRQFQERSRGAGHTHSEH